MKLVEFAENVRCYMEAAPKDEYLCHASSRVRDRLESENRALDLSDVEDEFAMEVRQVASFMGVVPIGFFWPCNEDGWRSRITAIDHIINGSYK